MKIKKVIATLSCAALITAAALPLTACGGGKSFKEGTVNLSDYAVEYKPAYEYSHKEVTKAEVKYEDDVEPRQMNDNRPNGEVSPYAVSGTTIPSGTIYNVTNVWTGNSLYSNLRYREYAYVQWVSSSSINVPLLRIQHDNDGETSFSYYGEHSDSIYSGSGHPGFSIKQYYVGNESEKSNVLVVTDKYSKSFFKVTKENHQCTYERLNESDIHFVDPEYEVGSGAYAAVQPIYSKTGENAVSGEIANYSYANVGSEFVFYKSGEETGRISSDNVDDDYMYFVGDYLYYAKLDQVEEKSKNANLIYVGDVEERYNYEFHRYDIIANKDVKLNYNVKIDYIEPLYNSKEKAYDAVVIVGAKLKNNTYQEGSNFTYIADKDLNVAYDISGADYSGAFKLYSLDDEHYMLQSGNSKTVFNKQMERVSEFDSAIYFTNEKLFAFSGFENNLGFANFEGKVVIDPVYELTGFYGGVAYATNTGTGEKVFLKADGTETAAPKTDRSFKDDRKCSFISESRGVYYTLESPTVNHDGSPTYCQLDLYNFSGTRIATVNNVQVQYLGSEIVNGYTVMGNFMVLPIVDKDDNITYKLVYLA